MIATSTEYKTAVDATIRRWRPRLQITWSDSTIDPTIHISDEFPPSERNRLDYPEQVYDLVLDPTFKWAHLDGVMVADGTYHPAPGTAEDGQMGWWGSVRGDVNGQWEYNPTITIDFDARPISALLVVGDSVYNEFPFSFRIIIYDTLGAILYNEVFTDNDDVVWREDISSENILTATRMSLEIITWNKPYRIVKILEFYTSEIGMYEGDDIISMNLLEEREIADGSIPVGNVASKELDIELQNIRITNSGTEYIDPFSYSNTASFFQNVLKKNRKIVAWIGLVLPDETVEYILLGTFWSGDWDNPEKSVVVSTSARDRMELLRKAEYKKSTIVEGVTLYSMMETLLTSAKVDIPMPDLVWDIDTDLLNYTVPYGYLPRQDYFKCIKQIVTACRGQAYMSRDDVLIVTGPTYVGEQS